MQEDKGVGALVQIEEQEPAKLSGADELPEASSSMSRRRGFRPLSIHTGKAFDPFGFSGSPKPDPENVKRSDSGPDTIDAEFAMLISSTRESPAFYGTDLELTTLSSQHHKSSDVPERSIFSQVSQSTTQDNL